jgi:hypothetical protein
MGDGGGNGQCAVCFEGLLPGWSGSDRRCQRAGCGGQAVARQRKRAVCREHATFDGISLDHGWCRWVEIDEHTGRPAVAAA